jgi:hypothetical protein
LTKELLTASSVRAYRSCPRLYFFKYERCIIPLRTEGPRRFGSLFHEGLDGWWSHYHDGIDARLNEALAKMETFRERNQVDDFDVVRAEELLYGYEARWFDEPVDVVLGVEHKFTTALRNPATGKSSPYWCRAGKTDAEVVIGDRKYIIEHKTTTEDISGGSDYWLRLRMDNQVSLYLDAREADGILYDVIRKPGIQPYKATPAEKRQYTQEKKCPKKTCGGSRCEDCGGTGVIPSRLYQNQREADETLDEFRARYRAQLAEDPDKWYARAEVVRTIEELRESRYDQWQTAQQIRQSRRDGCWPRNPDACKQYNRPCDYFEVCTGMAELEDPHRFQLIVKHPELEEQNQ